MTKTILVVDDEPDIAKVLAVRLVNYGFEVQIAHSGKDALARIDKKLPDLIILDIMMPVLSGTELAELLKDNKATARIPIIFLSALLSKEDEQSQATGGVENCIFAKPYDIKDLIAKIYEMIGK